MKDKNEDGATISAYDAYAMGWRRAALWANRDDLIADIDSPAYLRDITTDISTLIAAKLGKEGLEVSDGHGKRVMIFNEELVSRFADNVFNITSFCEVPPIGWFCTRESGHEGPCAAWPNIPGWDGLP